MFYNTGQTSTPSDLFFYLPTYHRTPSPPLSCLLLFPPGRVSGRGWEDGVTPTLTINL